MPGLPPKHGDVRHFVVEPLAGLSGCQPAIARSGVCPLALLWLQSAVKKTSPAELRRFIAELQGRSGTETAAPRANALVLAALHEARLASMADVARVYGEAISRAHPRLPNLIANGSFDERGPIDNVSPPGWALTGARFCTLSTEGVTEGLLAAVFGDGTAQSQPPTAHTAAISQKVDTRQGAHYRLTYDYAAFGNGAEANAQTLTLRIEGSQTILEHTVTSLGAVPPTFQQIKLDFVADGPAVTFRFFDGTSNGESGLTDGVLDNVRLVEISADGAALPAPRSPDSGDPDRIELVQLLLGPDSPTSLTLNDAANYYLYDAPIHGKVMELRKSLNEALAQSAATFVRAHVLAERPAPYDPRIFLRGDPVRRGAIVPRRFLQALAGDDRKTYPAGTARLDLARAIVDPANPLTARVLVNRIWQHHFGVGLVSTPSNFGLRGDVPSHPELLDYLAHRFVTEGWSIKQLHRWIVLSSTYQQSSRPIGGMPRARDPENRLLSKMNRERAGHRIAARTRCAGDRRALDRARSGRPAGRSGRGRLPAADDLWPGRSAEPGRYAGQFRFCQSRVPCAIAAYHHGPAASVVFAQQPVRPRASAKAFAERAEQGRGGDCCTNEPHRADLRVGVGPHAERDGIAIREVILGYGRFLARLCTSLTAVERVQLCGLTSCQEMLQKTCDRLRAHSGRARRFARAAAWAFGTLAAGSATGGTRRLRKPPRPRIRGRRVLLPLAPDTFQPRPSTSFICS